MTRLLATGRSSAVLLIWLLVGFPAAGQSPDSMRGECASVAKTYFRDFDARTDMTYNGQRTDGTHAINGRIFLETRYEDFACSFDRGGQQMVTFFAEGREQSAFLPGGGGNNPGSSTVQVTGVPANDVLNVRSGPGTSYGIVGALGNGDSVRNLGCQSEGNTRWCQIEMLTDMRERGWVSARYLALQGGAATQLPSASRTERVRFAAGESGTEFTDQLGTGTSVTYILRARNGQNLYFRLAANGPNMSWRLYNPDGTLLDEGSPSKEYSGELWQTGDHKIEVSNRGGSTQSFNVIFGIR